MNFEKEKKTFPWMKRVRRKFLKSFPNVTEETLSLLKENIHSEFEKLDWNDKARTEAFYATLSYFYLHLSMKSNFKEEPTLKFICVYLLYYLSYTGLILSDGNSDSAWINRILSALKSYPGGDCKIFDILLLVRNVPKKYLSVYKEILRCVLSEPHIHYSSGAENFMKMLLLFRRLKSLLKIDADAIDESIFVAKVECPPDLKDFISLHINGLANISEKNFIRKFLNKKLNSNVLENLFMALFKNKYDDRIIHCSFKDKVKNKSSTMLLKKKGKMNYKNKINDRKICSEKLYQKHEKKKLKSQLKEKFTGSENILDHPIAKNLNKSQFKQSIISTSEKSCFNSEVCTEKSLLKSNLSFSEDFRSATESLPQISDSQISTDIFSVPQNNFGKSHLGETDLCVPQSKKKRKRLKSKLNKGVSVSGNVLAKLPEDAFKKSECDQSVSEPFEQSYIVPKFHSEDTLIDSDHSPDRKAKSKTKNPLKNSDSYLKTDVFSISESISKNSHAEESSLQVLQSKKKKKKLKSKPKEDASVSENVLEQCTLSDFNKSQCDQLVSEPFKQSCIVSKFHSEKTVIDSDHCSRRNSKSKRKNPPKNSCSFLETDVVSISESILKNSHTEESGLLLKKKKKKFKSNVKENGTVSGNVSEQCTSDDFNKSECDQSVSETVLLSVASSNKCLFNRSVNLSIEQSCVSSEIHSKDNFENSDLTFNRKCKSKTESCNSSIKSNVPSVPQNIMGKSHLEESHFQESTDMYVSETVLNGSKDKFAERSCRNSCHSNDFKNAADDAHTRCEQEIYKPISCGSNFTPVKVSSGQSDNHPLSNIAENIARNNMYHSESELPVKVKSSVLQEKNNSNQSNCFADGSMNNFNFKIPTNPNHTCIISPNKVSSLQDISETSIKNISSPETLELFSPPHFTSLAEDEDYRCNSIYTSDSSMSTVSVAQYDLEQQNVKLPSKTSSRGIKEKKISKLSNSKTAVSKKKTHFKSKETVSTSDSSSDDEILSQSKTINSNLSVKPFNSNISTSECFNESINSNKSETECKKESCSLKSERIESSSSSLSGDNTVLNNPDAAICKMRHRKCTKSKEKNMSNTAVCKKSNKKDGKSKTFTSPSDSSSYSDIVLSQSKAINSNRSVKSLNSNITMTSDLFDQSVSSNKTKTESKNESYGLRSDKIKSSCSSASDGNRICQVSKEFISAIGSSSDNLLSQPKTINSNTSLKFLNSNVSTSDCFNQSVSSDINETECKNESISVTSEKIKSSCSSTSNCDSALQVSKESISTIDSSSEKDNLLSQSKTTSSNLFVKSVNSKINTSDCFNHSVSSNKNEKESKKITYSLRLNRVRSSRCFCCKSDDVLRVCKTPVQEVKEEKNGELAHSKTIIDEKSYKKRKKPNKLVSVNVSSSDNDIDLSQSKTVNSDLSAKPFNSNISTSDHFSQCFSSNKNEKECKKESYGNKRIKTSFSCSSEKDIVLSQLKIMNLKVSAKSFNSNISTSNSISQCIGLNKNEKECEKGICTLKSKRFKSSCSSSSDDDIVLSQLKFMNSKESVKPFNSNISTYNSSIKNSKSNENENESKIKNYEECLKEPSTKMPLHKACNIAPGKVEEKEKTLDSKTILSGKSHKIGKSRENVSNCDNQSVYNQTETANSNTFEKHLDPKCNSSGNLSKDLNSHNNKKKFSESNCEVLSEINQKNILEENELKEINNFNGTVPLGENVHVSVNSSERKIGHDSENLFSTSNSNCFELQGVVNHRVTGIVNFSSNAAHKEICENSNDSSIFHSLSSESSEKLSTTSDVISDDKDHYLGEKSLGDQFQTESTISPIKFKKLRIILCDYLVHQNSPSKLSLKTSPKVLTTSLENSTFFSASANLPNKENILSPPKLKNISFNLKPATSDDQKILNGNKSTDKVRNSLVWDENLKLPLEKSMSSANLSPYKQTLIDGSRKKSLIEPCNHDSDQIPPKINNNKTITFDSLCRQSVQEPNLNEQEKNSRRSEDYSSDVFCKNQFRYNLQSPECNSNSFISSSKNVSPESDTSSGLQFEKESPKYKGKLMRTSNAESFIHFSASEDDLIDNETSLDCGSDTADSDLNDFIVSDNYESSDDNSSSNHDQIYIISDASECESETTSLKSSNLKQRSHTKQKSRKVISETESNLSDDEKSNKKALKVISDSDGDKDSCYGTASNNSQLLNSNKESIFLSDVVPQNKFSLKEHFNGSKSNSGDLMTFASDNCNQVFIHQNVSGDETSTLSKNLLPGGETEVSEKLKSKNVVSELGEVLGDKRFADNTQQMLGISHINTTHSFNSLSPNSKSGSSLKTDISCNQTGTRNNEQHYSNQNEKSKNLSNGTVRTSKHNTAEEEKTKENPPKKFKSVSKDYSDANEPNKFINSVIFNQSEKALLDNVFSSLPDSFCEHTCTFLEPACNSCSFQIPFANLLTKENLSSLQDDMNFDDVDPKLSKCTQKKNSSVSAESENYKSIKNSNSSDQIKDLNSKRTLETSNYTRTAECNGFNENFTQYILNNSTTRLDQQLNEMGFEMDSESNCLSIVKSLQPEILSSTHTSATMSSAKVFVEEGEKSVRELVNLPKENKKYLLLYDGGKQSVIEICALPDEILDKAKSQTQTTEDNHNKLSRNIENHNKLKNNLKENLSSGYVFVDGMKISFSSLLPDVNLGTRCDKAELKTNKVQTRLKVSPYKIPEGVICRRIKKHENLSPQENTEKLTGNPETTSDVQPQLSSGKKDCQKRHRYSSAQIKVLEAEFELNKYPSKAKRTQLAQTLNLTDSQIRIWFQNQRAKWKREYSTNQEILQLCCMLPSCDHQK